MLPLLFSNKLTDCDFDLPSYQHHLHEIKMQTLFAFLFVKTNDQSR
jgi:hypothetical protein